jgi:hypothetical protein
MTGDGVLAQIRRVGLTVAVPIVVMGAECAF